MRLICFPYAGGSAAVYRALQASLPGIEVRRHELAGRGSRLSEPAVRDMSTLVDTLLRDLDDCFDRPFALLGHSMGAAIAAELALRLPAHARPNLRHLFVSARAAPGHERHDRRMQALDDRAFIDALREMGGTPRAVLDNSELMALLMPALRADFTMIENHRPVPGPGLAVDITAFAGRADKEVPVDAVEGWGAATTGRFDFHVFDGDHFFLRNEMRTMAGIIAARMRRPEHAASSALQA
ncbi:MULTISPECIES: thioesterase II family protein [Burkholderia]|jgi:surfactin synthase thioesterase subunit|uniref:Alpha/beta fold hydrolase n=3 Tax=Burkholderia contaminans TaxID=488447 RepID=A0A1E3FS91_9BURK|nr:MULTISPECIES: alpha/beta fold hydrolase [Burkholderia]KKL42005.1 oleoyl-ACP hydrolase [Burkholderia contaminans LMG 23361]MBA9829857.1 thioesterase [Burkholderia contaminans]MBA9837143.1 thioesterase [Burkholderia contaminans]MBA9861773.1 thioesterase [Burkholderia contaminans]MBA9904913.1 thioesterase [Burkholderia contaminans]